MSNPRRTVIPAVAPGTIERQRPNEYYNSDEEYLEAIAKAMHEPGECVSMRLVLR
jgi:hypothetical protein